MVLIQTDRSLILSQDLSHDPMLHCCIGTWWFVFDSKRKCICCHIWVLSVSPHPAKAEACSGIPHIAQWNNSCTDVWPHTHHSFVSGIDTDWTKALYLQLEKRTRSVFVVDYTWKNKEETMKVNDCNQTTKGTVHPKEKIHIFPFACRDIYQSRLFWCELPCFGDMSQSVSHH